MTDKKGRRKPPSQRSVDVGEAKIEKHEKKMSSGIGQLKSPDSDNRVIDGYAPQWITRENPKKPDETERRNIFALRHSEFRAFVYDMLKQMNERLNAFEMELGRQAIQMKNYLAPISPLPQQKKPSEPEDTVEEEEE